MSCRMKWKMVTARTTKINRAATTPRHGLEHYCRDLNGWWVRYSNLAHFALLIWPPWETPDGKIPGWTGGAKWSYSKRSGAILRPEIGLMDYLISTAHTGGWCARGSHA